jgi:putative ABC transport system permease protein
MRPIRGSCGEWHPAPGEVWIDARLAARLDVHEGARLAVGETTLTVAAIVQQDPEVTGGLFTLGPKLLMNIDDVAATKLLQPGNRATWRLLVAGPASDAYRDWVKARWNAGSASNRSAICVPKYGETLERAEQFLGLASLVAAILAAAAVALAASRSLRRHLDSAAMMRCLGAGERQVLAMFSLQFVVLGLAASIAGCVIALGGQQVLAILLGSMVRAELPPPTVLPALWAFATGILLLLGFALPPLIALARVPPLRVLRRDIGMPRAGGAFAYAFGAATVALLIAAQAQDAKMALIMIGGIAALLAAAAVIARLLVAAVRLLPQRGYSWRYGLANLRRRPLGASMQIGSLGLGLMALLLLTLVRGDLMQNWRATLPADAPTVFLINVLPDQAPGVRDFLKRELLVDAVSYPMVRGRLVAINDVPFDTTQLADERAGAWASVNSICIVADLPASNRMSLDNGGSQARSAACRSRTASPRRCASSSATLSPGTSSARG